MEHPGIILKKLRESRGLTERALIEKLYSNKKQHDFNIIMIKAWERGVTNLYNDLLIRIANFFNVSIAYLFGF